VRAGAVARELGLEQRADEERVVGQLEDSDVPRVVAGAEADPAGLEARGGNIFVATTASGDAQTGVPGADGLGTIAQGFLEDSNVSVVEEMVNMILGQRAYEANSKVVKAADEMYQMMNNVTR